MSERASGPVPQSVFLAVLDHSAILLGGTGDWLSIMIFSKSEQCLLSAPDVPAPTTTSTAFFFHIVLPSFNGSRSSLITS